MINRNVCQRKGIIWDKGNDMKGDVKGGVICVLN